jgi:hypothetical protein
MTIASGGKSLYSAAFFLPLAAVKEIQRGK